MAFAMTVTQWIKTACCVFEILSSKTGRLEMFRMCFFRLQSVPGIQKREEKSPADNRPMEMIPVTFCRRWYGVF
jgi:hypothetical protein